MTLTPIITQILSVLTVLGQIIIVFLLVCLIVRKRETLSFVGRNAILFSFIVALAATLGSLFYSEAAGFEPCKLCWFQRIFMYPQVVLLGLALWKRDYRIAIYSIALSAIGAVIAAYHYLLQIGVAPSVPCSAVGYSVSCSQRFVLQFGYITIPMMAFTAFILILLLQIIQKNLTKKL